MAVNAAAYVAAAAAAGGAYEANKSRQDAKAARREMKKERQQAETDAAMSANARVAMQRQALKQNSLLASPGRNQLGAG